MNQANPPSISSRSLLALLLLIPAPSLGVLAAMGWLKGHALGNPLWGITKVWIVALPVVWLLYVDRGRVSFSPLAKPRRKSAIIAGMVSGIAIFILILAGYFLFAQHWIDGKALREHLIETGLDSLARYLALCVFLIVVNSAVEAYVWRWFVYTRCRTLLPAALAVIASGFAFTIHHVFVLGFNFQWDWRVVLLGSVGVFVGGVTWSILYATYRSVWVGWISHAWADLAIFIIGYLLLFGSE